MANDCIYDCRGSSTIATEEVLPNHYMVRTPAICVLHVVGCIPTVGHRVALSLLFLRASFLGEAKSSTIVRRGPKKKVGAAPLSPVAASAVTNAYSREATVSR